MVRPVLHAPRRERAPLRSANGSTLIELMIALGVLAVGLLAMWHLHVLGLTSTAAGRRHTVASAVARELVSGIERLGYADDRLSATYLGPASDSGPPTSALFGSLVDASGAIRSVPSNHEWNDSDAQRIPGVRKNTEMPEQAEGTGYERRWTVWDVLPPGATSGAVGAKLVAVSVIWRDPPFARPREVVLYTQVANPSAIVSGMMSSQ